MEVKSLSIVRRPRSVVAHLIKYCVGVPSASSTTILPVTVHADVPNLLEERTLTPSGKAAMTFSLRGNLLLFQALQAAEDREEYARYCSSRVVDKLEGSKLRVEEGRHKKQSSQNFKTQALLHA
jgi:hypothetical protein